MPKPISRKILIRKLKNLGFGGPFSGGKHQFMGRNEFKVFIPNPHGDDIGSVLLGRIFKEIKISEEDFNDL